MKNQGPPTFSQIKENIGKIIRFSTDTGSHPNLGTLKGVDVITAKQIEEAVKNKGNHYSVSSDVAVSYAKKHGYCVVMNYNAFAVPSENITSWEIEEPPIEVELNSEYKAEVHPHYVKVGCQSFEFTAIEALYANIQIQKQRNKNKN